MAKVFKLGLVWGERQYEVKTITNSTRYTPGQWLNPPEVQKLCDDAAWDVTITDDQTFQLIVGAIAGIGGVAAGKLI